MRLISALLLTLLLATPALAALPDPPKDYYPFQIPFTSSLNLVSAADLLEKPAGKAGPILVKADHFYTSDNKRIRFWGVSTAFSANFPTHTQADAVALRLASLGINCVRLHHMDAQKFPNGIFANDQLETLSPEALDRLDYFIAALKKQGIYVNLNLHVSAAWARTHKLSNADQLDGDKIADIFYPPLIEAQKQYAKDLLTHVNAYTKTAYAAEPAIAMVEINNEDSLFLWGGDQKIADLPDPYAATLTKLWNQWLAKKYGTREKLEAAWNIGSEKLGKDLLRDEFFQTTTKPADGKSDWYLELHEGAQAKIARQDLTPLPCFATIDVSKVDGTSWHVQFGQSGFKLKKGQFYTVSFFAVTGKSEPFTVSVGQAHAPWNNLGLSATIPSDRNNNRLGFVAEQDEDDARLSFIVGQQARKVQLASISLAPGGREGLRDAEDPAKNTVARRTPGDPVSQSRQDDWFDFLQQTDESFFTFLFAYSHSSKFETRSEDAFFDLEGNSAKLAQMPFGARIFVGGAVPQLFDVKSFLFPVPNSLQQAPQFYHQLYDQLRSEKSFWSQPDQPWSEFLSKRVELWSVQHVPTTPSSPVGRLKSLSLEASGPGTGRYSCIAPQAKIFAGFVNKPVDLGELRIESSTAPFVTLMTLPLDSAKFGDRAPTLLCLVPRSANTGMQWNPARTSVSDQWGKGPAQLERVDVTLSLPVTPGKAPPKVIALTPEGKPSESMKVESKDNRYLIYLKADSPWFQLTH